jgi:PPM family protein phosphatase
MIPREIEVEVGARTETGYVRNENQDRMSWASLPAGQLYIVADGMGGHAGGAKAASLTTEYLQKYLRESQVTQDLEDSIKSAFQKTNKVVYDQGHCGDPVTEGMGSTAVMLIISGKYGMIAHVGDSRAYLFRKGKLTRLTKDHSQVQRMVDAGMLTPELARVHPSSNILDLAVGNNPNVEVSIKLAMKLKKDDCILLCSDGLSGYCDDPEIAAVLDLQDSPQQNVDRLINLALSKGGEDNVTVQVIKIANIKKTQWLLWASFLGSITKVFLVSVCLLISIVMLNGYFQGHLLNSDSLPMSIADIKKTGIDYIKKKLNTLDLNSDPVNSQSSPPGSGNDSELLLQKQVNDLTNQVNQLTTSNALLNQQVAALTKQKADIQKQCAKPQQKVKKQLDKKVDKVKPKPASTKRIKPKEKLDALFN